MGALTISNSVEINTFKKALFELVKNIEGIPDFSYAVGEIRDFSGKPPIVGSSWEGFLGFSGKVSIPEPGHIDTEEGYGKS